MLCLTHKDSSQACLLAYFFSRDTGRGGAKDAPSTLSYPSVIITILLN